jgi:hypothetical protein
MNDFSESLALFQIATALGLIALGVFIYLNRKFLKKNNK